MNSNDALSADALVLVLQTVHKQAAAIKRLEEVVAAGAATQWGSTSASCHQEHALQQLQSRLAVLEQRSAEERSGMADRMRHVEQRVTELQAHSAAIEERGQQLQQQMGWLPVPPGPDAAGSGGRGSNNRSMAARMQVMEQQVDCLSAAAADAQDKMASTAAAAKALESKLAKQLSNIRADVQQALAVTAGSVKRDVEAAAAAREALAARAHQQQADELAASFQAQLLQCQRSVSSSVLASCERQVQAAQAAAEARVATVQAQLDALAADKADVTLVTQYTGQVADVFEQLATTVADSTQASIAQLMTQQQELRAALASLDSSKADRSAIAQHQQHWQQQLAELQQRVVSALQDSEAAAARFAAAPVEAVRLQLAEVQGGVEALQAQVSGLQASSAAASSGQQQHDQQLEAVASGQQMLQQQLQALATHVDPAAAAQLAAAAAGDECVLSYAPLGDIHSLLCQGSLELVAGSHNGADSWLTGSYMQAAGGSSSSAGGSRWTSAVQAAGPTGRGSRSAGGARPASCVANAKRSCSGQAQVQGAPTSNDTAATAAAAGQDASASGARVNGVLQHLPVAVRLLRLESAVRELGAQAGDMATGSELQQLSQQQAALSSQLAGVLAQVDGSVGMRQIDEQVASLAHSVAVLSSSLQDCPTRSEVSSHVAEAVAAAEAAALAAVQPLQRQLQDCKVAAASPKRLVGLDAKLKLLAAEVVGLQDQAALAAHVQDQHTTMVSALEAAVEAQAGKEATLLQQLRTEMREAAAKAAQAQQSATAAVERSVREQGAALADIAAAVGALPVGLLESAVAQAAATPATAGTPRGVRLTAAPGAGMQSRGWRTPQPAALRAPPACDRRQRRPASGSGASTATASDVTASFDSAISVDATAPAGGGSGARGAGEPVQGQPAAAGAAVEAQAQQQGAAGDTGAAREVERAALHQQAQQCLPGSGGKQQHSSRVSDGVPAAAGCASPTVSHSLAAAAASGSAGSSQQRARASAQQQLQQEHMQRLLSLQQKVLQTLEQHGCGATAGPQAEHAVQHHAGVGSSQGSEQQQQQQQQQEQQQQQQQQGAHSLLQQLLDAEPSEL